MTRPLDKLSPWLLYDNFSMTTEDTHSRVPPSIVQSLKRQLPFSTTGSPEKPTTPTVKLPPLSLLSTQVRKTKPQFYLVTL